MEWKLYVAATEDNLSRMREIIRNSPTTINVNWHEAFFGKTVLHVACAHGNHSIITFLLAHPGIDVTQKFSFSFFF